MANKISRLQRVLPWRKHKLLYFFLILGILSLVIHVRAGLVAPPAGTYYQGQEQIARQLAFHVDDSWLNQQGERELQQSIFDEVLARIRAARELILIDMFLFNDFQGPVAETTRAISGELTRVLVEQKQAFPDMRIVVISDPINTVYGGTSNAGFDLMKDAGIELVLTELNQLRDSNAVYSFIWRWLIAPFGNQRGDTVPNPFGAGRVTIRSYLKMANFKANHRKILLSDTPEGLQALVTSANPHDGSSAHRNVALSFGGPAVHDLLVSENAVLALSGVPPVTVPVATDNPTEVEETGVRIQVLTEKRIKDRILDLLRTARTGDRVDLLMFYLADRDVVKALVDASRNGVLVRVILDVNRDAFGRQKNGVPNKPVAHELHRAGIPVRWCSTAGEQCHAKMLLSSSGSTMAMLSGSANFTRRNLENFNLETDVALYGSPDHPVLRQAQDLFDRYWSNDDQRKFTVAYAEHRDERQWLRWLYLFMEASGLSTF